MRYRVGGVVGLLIGSAVLLGNGIREARACAVCFGDPNSSMAKGAVAGVVVLLAIIGCVLAAFAGTGFYWIHRSRRLNRAEGCVDPVELRSGRAEEAP